MRKRKDIGHLSIYLIGFSIINIIAKFFVGSIDEKATFFIANVVVKLFLFGVTVYVLRSLDINYKLLNKRNLIWIVFSLLLIVFSLYSNYQRIARESINVNSLEHYSYFFQCFSVGLFEEFFCRVLIFSMVCRITAYAGKKAPIQEILTTSLLFGLLHVSNFFNPNYEFTGVFVQIIFAMLFGAVLQSLLISVKNIWFVITIHTIINYFGMINTKLFGISSAEGDLSTPSDFMDSLITISILGLVLLPICYLLVRKQRILFTYTAK